MVTRIDRSSIVKREQVMKRVGGGDAVETNKNVGRKQREEETEKKQQEFPNKGRIVWKKRKRKRRKEDY